MRALALFALLGMAGCADILGLDEVDTLPDLPFSNNDGIDAARPPPPADASTSDASDD